VSVKPPAGFQPASEQVVVRRGMKPKYFILEPIRQPGGDQPGGDQPGNVEPNDQLVKVLGSVMARSTDPRTKLVPLRNVVTVWTRRSETPNNATSDFRGRFGLALEPGTYAVYVKAPRGYKPEQRQVVVRPGMGTQTFVLTPIQQPGGDPPGGVEPLDQRVAVRGFVVTRSKDRRTSYKPLSNVVTVWAHGGWSPSNATSGSRGEFTLSLKPTTYSVYVKAPRGYRPKQQKIEVRQGMKPVYLVLDPVATTVPETNTLATDRLHDLFSRREQGTGTAGSSSQGSRKMVTLNVRVYERVAQKPTRPIPGAQVFVEQNRSRKGSAQTDSRGAASLKLAPGAYRVYVKHQAYGGKFEDVKLSSLVTSRTIYFDKPGGSQPGTTGSLQRVSPIDTRALMRGPLNRKPEARSQTNPQGSNTQLVIPRTYVRRNSSSGQSATATKPDKKDEAEQQTTVNPAVLRQLLERRRAAARQPEAQPGPY
jgi:hypothetical protein